MTWRQLHSSVRQQASDQHVPIQSHFRGVHASSRLWSKCTTTTACTRACIRARACVYTENFEGSTCNESLHRAGQYGPCAVRARGRARVCCGCARTRVCSLLASAHVMNPQPTLWPCDAAMSSWSSTHSRSQYPPPTSPSPPALDTAAARAPPGDGLEVGKEGRHICTAKRCSPNSALL